MRPQRLRAKSLFNPRFGQIWSKTGIPKLSDRLLDALDMLVFIVVMRMLVLGMAVPLRGTGKAAWEEI
jgi:hypothetical protein